MAGTNTIHASTTFDVDAISLTPATGDNVSGGTKGTATSGGANTLTDTNQNWTTDQWANAQVKITAGTGAGQTRIIASNTATQSTVTTNWTTPPDNTSQYEIEDGPDAVKVYANPHIHLEKLVNGVFDTEVNCPTVTAGSTVTYKYLVTKSLRRAP